MARGQDVFRARGGAQQRARIGVAFGVLVQHCGGRPGFHHAPAVHDGDAIGQPRDHADVVADEHHGHAEARLQIVEQVDDARLDGGIQPGGGLVGDQHFRLGGQRHGDHGALAHAAGKPVGMVVKAHARRIDAHLFQPVQRLVPGLSRALDGGVQAHGFGDLFAHRLERIERGAGVLEDHGNLPAAHALQVAVGLLLPQLVVLGDAHDAAVAALELDVGVQPFQQVLARIRHET